MRELPPSPRTTIGIDPALRPLERRAAQTIVTSRAWSSAFSGSAVSDWGEGPPGAWGYTIDRHGNVVIHAFESLDVAREWWTPMYRDIGRTREVLCAAFTTDALARYGDGARASLLFGAGDHHTLPASPVRRPAPPAPSISGYPYPGRLLRG